MPSGTKEVSQTREMAPHLSSSPSLTTKGVGQEMSACPGRPRGRGRPSIPSLLSYSSVREEADELMKLFDKDSNGLNRDEFKNVLRKLDPDQRDVLPKHFMYVCTTTKNQFDYVTMSSGGHGKKLTKTMTASSANKS